MAKKQNNDDKVLKLQDLIKEKKLKLAKSKTFSPVTNASIELDGTRYNLHATAKPVLVLLLVKLSVYKEVAEELEVLDDLVISGYHVSTWIADIKAKLDNINIATETAKLKDLEKKLFDLLSSDKKVELELKNIEDMI